MEKGDIQIIILDGQHGRPLCLAWAESLCDVKMASDVWKSRTIYSDLAVWRNRCCQWFLDRTDKKAVLLLEDTKCPDVNTLPVIESDAHIVGTSYCNRHGKLVHPTDGIVGTGCLRISRQALEDIPRPWFNYTLKPDGLGIDKCSCVWFCHRAMDAGYHPVKAGRMNRMAMFLTGPDGSIEMKGPE